MAISFFHSRAISWKHNDLLQALPYSHGAVGVSGSYDTSPLCRCAYRALWIQEGTGAFRKTDHRKKTIIWILKYA